MNFSLQQLEFSQLLDYLSGFADTPQGKSKILSSRPLSDLAVLNLQLQELKETAALAAEGFELWRFNLSKDPSQALDYLGIQDKPLSADQILLLAEIFSQALAVRKKILSTEFPAPALKSLVSKVRPELAHLIEKIRKSILPNGEIDDRASLELKRIRSEISSLRNRITRRLEKFLDQIGQAAQDKVITIRSDRFVVPVKADFRGEVQGVAHGFSSSGQTVFLEPLEIIEANNEIQSLIGSEQREIARILSELADSIRLNLGDIFNANEVVSRLDQLSAYVRFYQMTEGTVPEVSESDRFELIEAKHPLLLAASQLDKRKVVPSSITLHSSQKALVISGANAGGKTVILKTAGLLSLMALCAMPITAQKAHIPLFRSILADIGDHQSIAANLSTFTSHLESLATIHKSYSQPGLILLDEVGTGTDPEEGSALAISVIEHFLNLGSFLIATTHYPQVKAFAVGNSSIQSAAVEFDLKSLRPTYRLLTGQIGASVGLEIAARFGLPQEIIKQAKFHLSETARLSQEFLIKMQSGLKELEDAKNALEIERQAVAESFNQLQQKLQILESENARLITEKIDQIVKDFTQKAEAALEAINDAKTRAAAKREFKVSLSQMNNLREKLAKNDQPLQTGLDYSPEFQSPAESAATRSQPQKNAPVKLTPGVKVKTRLGHVGIIEKIENSTAELIVGNFRLKEKLDNLSPIEPESKPRRPPARTQTTLFKIDGDNTVPTEINLIGKTILEAESELERFIDRAYAAAQRRVRIIHGHGTGTLRRFVADYLKNHPLVESFALAAADRGGSGATEVDLLK